MSLNTSEELFNVMIPFGDDFYYVKAKEVFEAFEQVINDLENVSL